MPADIGCSAINASAKPDVDLESVFRIKNVSVPEEFVITMRRLDISEVH
jgi:hypothetical protein